MGFFFLCLPVTLPSTYPIDEDTIVLESIMIDGKDDGEDDELVEDSEPVVEKQPDDGFLKLDYPFVR
jgi:hypothetical protein